MAEGKKKVEIKEERESDKWCFVCKDGGKMIICDYKQCSKPYHPECVGKDASVFRSRALWNCGWHDCFSCKNPSNLHCYTCPKSYCRRCIPRPNFLQVKDKYGFCKDCLKLAFLIEENKNYDSEGTEVDFTDLDTEEGLFKEYYLLIKEQEGLEARDLYDAQDRVKTKKKQLSGSSTEEDFDEDKEDHVSDHDGLEIEKKKRPKTRKEDDSARRLAPRTCQITVDMEKIDPKKVLRRSVYASIVVENLKLIYLKRSVLYELQKEPETFEEKVIGCFIRVRVDRYDPAKGLHQQIVQIKGIRKVSNIENNSDTILEFAVMPKETRIKEVSDGDFYADEFEDLRKKLQAGVFERPTMVELERKAKILHKDITKDWIEKELYLLGRRMDHANEKGWRQLYPFEKATNSFRTTKVARLCS
ncbi:hypothetical protein ACJIZ3_001045 [Penstemon smallii]|uniref:Plus3 domain-containing protein n=1 Tax=Penstemon smallii TaxID=265156 RepID=A0ABD3U3J9_9LAMI